MGGPGIALILLQAVEFSHILRKTNSLKGSHVLAAGKHIGTWHFRVDLHDSSGDEFPFVHLHSGKCAAERRNKVTPDDRLICDCRNLSGRYYFRLYNFKPLFQKYFAVFPGCPFIKEQMQCIKIFILRINPICCKTTAQTVGTVMHRFHGFANHLAGHSFAVSGNNSSNRAA